MKVLILTSRDVFCLLPMWKEIFKSKTASKFYLIVIKKEWQLCKPSSDIKGPKIITALLLFCLHYGLGNTLRKIFYKFCEKWFNFSFEQRRIKRVCANFKIPIWIIDAPEGAKFETVIADIAPDIILYQSHVKLDERIIRRIPYGVINRHPSRLPSYRGCFPVFWAKAYKDYKKMGVTLFRMDKKYDTGDILMQRAIRVGEKDSLRDIYNKTYAVGVEMIVDLLGKIVKQSNLSACKQENQGFYYGWPSLAQAVKFACGQRL